MASVTNVWKANKRELVMMAHEAGLTVHEGWTSGEIRHIVIEHRKGQKSEVPKGLGKMTLQELRDKATELGIKYKADAPKGYLQLAIRAKGPDEEVVCFGEVQAPPAPRGPPELPGRQPERLGRPEEAENRKETSRSTQSVDPLPYEASEAESSTTPKRWVINHWRSDQLPIRPKGRAPPPPSQSSGHRGYREDRTTNKQTRRVAEEKDEERVTPAGFSPSQAVFRKDPATPGDLLSGQDEERFLEIMTADRKRQKEASVRSAARVAFFRSQTDTRLRRALIQRARVKHTAYHIGEMVCFSTGLRRARLSEEFGADQVCWSEARGPTNLWVSYGGRCHLVAEEHLRPSTAEELNELLSTRVAKDDLDRLLRSDPDPEP